MIERKTSKLSIHLLNYLVRPLNRQFDLQNVSFKDDFVSTAASSKSFDGLEPFLPPTSGGYVWVDAISTAGQTIQLVNDLKSLGAKETHHHNRMVSALMPLSQLISMESLTSLQFAMPVLASTNVGLVTSQDTEAVQADIAQSSFGVKGSDVTIGILSDSFDVGEPPGPDFPYPGFPLTDAATDIANGDLPRDLIILQDLNPGDGGIDEGRAIAQLAYDIAPDAGIQFATAFTGQAGFANNILALRDAGSDIIVDDVIYFAEPMFADGIIAQAAAEVVADGIPYFSSAGNNFDDGYQAAFQNSQVTGFFGGTTHDWDPSPDIDPVLDFTLETGVTILVLNWDEPYASSGLTSPGSSVDIDFWLTNSGTNPTSVIPFLSSFSNNLGGDPIEIIGINNSGPPIELGLAIELVSGSAPDKMSIVAFAPGLSSIFGSAEYPFSGATTYGHAQAEGALGVGAARWNSTPRFGLNPPVLEPFSSLSGIPILFNTNGDPLLAPEVREGVDFVATDGGNTTFFFADSIIDPDSLPNFFGTSAAAPNAAAIAALMLEANSELKPYEIEILLEKSSIDMDNPFTKGFDIGKDLATGSGLIQADRAVASAFVTNTTIIFTPLSDNDQDAFTDNIVKPGEKLTPSNRPRDQRFVAIVGQNDNQKLDAGETGFILSEISKTNRLKTLSLDNLDDPVTVTAMGLSEDEEIIDQTNSINFSESFGFGLRGSLNYGDALTFGIEYGGTIASVEFTVTRLAEKSNVGFDVDGDVIKAIPEEDEEDGDDLNIVNDAAAQIFGIKNGDHISIDFLNAEVNVNGAVLNVDFDSLFNAFTTSGRNKITIGATLSENDDDDDDDSFMINNLVLHTGPATLNSFPEPILTTWADESGVFPPEDGMFS